MKILDYLRKHRAVVIIIAILVLATLEPVEQQQQEPKKEVWVWPALAIAGSLPFIYMLYKNTFMPTAFPGYVWILGFVVLVLMLRRR